jgi:hypothetical protein
MAKLIGAFCNLLRVRREESRVEVVKCVTGNDSVRENTQHPHVVPEGTAAQAGQ